MIEDLAINIEPLVTQVGRETEFSLVPGDPAGRLPQRDYEISLVHRVSRESARLKGTWTDAGRVNFSCSSDVAGECIVSASYPGGQWRRLGSLYNADADLAGRLPMRGDLHMHTWYSDGRASPIDMVLRGRDLGLDFLAITDHDMWQASVEAREEAESLGTPPIVLLGEEVSFARGHLVAIAGGESVTAKRSLPGYESERSAIAAGLAERQLSRGMPGDLYGDAVWTARAARAAGALTYIAHPFWVADDEFHVDRRVATQLVLDHEVDGIELIGDVEFEGNLLAISWNEDMLRQGVSAPVVGNSDTHGKLHTFGYHWTMAFAREYSQAGVLEALKSGHTLACTSAENGNTRIYGPLRLVEYAYFLQRSFLRRKDGLCARLSPLDRDGHALGTAVRDLYRREFGHL